MSFGALIIVQYKLIIINININNNFNDVYFIIKLISQCCFVMNFGQNNHKNKAYNMVGFILKSIA
ncbi:hypothetical protein AKJ17_03620 [Vibrio nereis]|uniref:Uncharacterized protein n=1 Tax=Vibrio nereis TaxID=693 RepID=A0A0M0HS83_VIBNE|nr:hypothetical protein AKJ17_03620 [Vibrio nereis]